MGWVRINPDGSRTPVAGDPFQSAAPVAPGEPAAAPQVPAGGEAAPTNPLADILLSAGAGLRRGSEAAVGMPGEVAKGMRWAAEQTGRLWGSPVDQDYIAGKDARGREREDLALTPDVKTVQDASTARFGESHKPETRAGKFANTVGEFVPGAFVGGATRAPLSLSRYLFGSAVLPGAASEAAGQATEGTSLEPAARFLGGLTGGAIGGMTQPRQALTARQGQRGALVEAAERRGVEGMPSYMMPDAPGQRVTAQRLADLPFLGSPVRRASEDFAENLGRRVQETAEDAASTAGNADYTGATVRTADTLDRYMRETMPRSIGQEFDALEATFTAPNARTQPHAARTIMRELMDAPSDAKRRINQRVVDLIGPDINRRNGLTFAEAKDLRSVVGAMMDDNTMPDFASVNPALRRVYGALTQDMENAVRRAGGSAALAQWQRANHVTRAMKDIGEDVQKVAGRAGDVPADTIMTRLRQLGRMRDDSTRQRLNMIRMAVEETDAAAWEDLGGALLADIGRDPKNPGRFSPQNFAREYDTLSAEGREIFWPDPDTRAAIDDFAALSRAFVEAREPSKFGIPMMAGGAAGLGSLAVASWPAALATALTSRVIGEILSRPAGAQKLVSWARAQSWAASATPASVMAASQALADEAAAITGEDGETILNRLLGRGDGRR